MTRVKKAQRILTVLATAGMAILPAACAAYGEKDPAVPQWFKDRTHALEKESFPKLASVPPAPQPSRPAAAWTQMETELRAAEAALAASPRSAPADATADATAAFEEDARADAARRRATAPAPGPALVPEPMPAPDEAAGDAPR